MMELLLIVEVFIVERQKSQPQIMIRINLLI